ncbi:MAG: type II secretion system protein [Bacilli bacterium]
MVELLAVISLLGIIGLISVPIISNSLKNSKKNAFKQTLNAIIDSAKMYNAENDYEGFTNLGIDITDGTIQFENSDEIISGKIYYRNKNYFLENVKTNKFCGTGNLGYYIIYQGECGSGIVLEDNYN